MPRQALQLPGGGSLLAAALLVACLAAAADGRTHHGRGSLTYTPTGNTVYYNLTITYGFWAPDCVNKQVYLVNGAFPGPPITATEGDTLVVTVRNGLQMEGLSIHWHGIKQVNNNLMDGTSFVTQCPISPGDYKVYSMPLDKAGTYLYHGHLGAQSTAGIYGMIIVKDPPAKPFPYPVDGELTLLLSDWWHRSVYEQVAGLDSKPFNFVGESQSFLMNGKGQYNCSLVPASLTPSLPNAGDVVTCNASNPQCATEVLTVDPGKTYRLRVASIASLQSYNLVFEGHNLTAVAADGYAIKPYTVGPEGLDIYSGQSVELLLTANQSSNLYWIRTSVIARPPKTPFGLAVLKYSDYVSLPNGLPTSAPPLARAFNDSAAMLYQAERYRADASVPKVSKYSDRTFILVGAQQSVNGYLRWAISNYSLVLPAIPYALGLESTAANQAAYTPMPPQNVSNPWDYSLPAPFDAQFGSGYYKFPADRWIDIVLQNTNNAKPNSSEAHPWHMHGHNFYVLAYGNGTYSQSSDTALYNTVDPPLRNTVTVMPFGWAVIRFKTDNRGVWMFHCHIASHLHMGMAIVFVDGTTVNVDKKVPRCGFH